MQKGFQVAALTGALLTAMSGASFAADNLSFGGWDVTKGTVDHTKAAICQSDQFDCVVVAGGDGFKQIQVNPSTENTTTDPNDSYVMTIVTDQQASGAYGGTGLQFYDVSFIKMKMNLGGNGDSVNQNGIFAEQKILDSTTSGASNSATFKSASNISTGWALGGSSPVVISQELVDNGDVNMAGDDFESNFRYASDNDATTGARTGFEMSIDQVAGLQSAGQTTSAKDIQVFALRERQGTKLSGTSGSVALGGTTMTWDATDATGSQTEDVKAIWLGQSINLDDTSASQGALGSTFGYLSFDNVSDAALPSSEFGFAASKAQGAGDWQWDPVFNFDATTAAGAPNICDPTGNVQPDPVTGACP